MTTIMKTPRAASAALENGVIRIEFDNGTHVEFDPKRNARLMNATPKQVADFRLSPSGIHWDKLDEDLSFEGILRGDFGR